MNVQGANPDSLQKTSNWGKYDFAMSESFFMDIRYPFLWTIPTELLRFKPHENSIHIRMGGFTLERERLT